jgi:hypothetical protein
MVLGVFAGHLWMQRHIKDDREIRFQASVPPASILWEIHKLSDAEFALFRGVLASTVA